MRISQRNHDELMKIIITQLKRTIGQRDILSKSDREDIRFLEKVLHAMKTHSPFQEVE